MHHNQQQMLLQKVISPENLCPKQIHIWSHQLYPQDQIRKQSMPNFDPSSEHYSSEQEQQLFDYNQQDEGESVQLCTVQNIKLQNRSLNQAVQHSKQLFAFQISESKAIPQPQSDRKSPKQLNKISCSQQKQYKKQQKQPQKKQQSQQQPQQQVFKSIRQYQHQFQQQTPKQKHSQSPTNKQETIQLIQVPNKDISLNHITQEQYNHIKYTYNQFSHKDEQILISADYDQYTQTLSQQSGQMGNKQIESHQSARLQSGSQRSRNQQMGDVSKLIQRHLKKQNQNKQERCQSQFDDKNCQAESQYKQKGLVLIYQNKKQSGFNKQVIPNQGQKQTQNPHKSLEKLEQLNYSPILSPKQLQNHNNQQVKIQEKYPIHMQYKPLHSERVKYPIHTQQDPLDSGREKTPSQSKNCSSKSPGDNVESVTKLPQVELGQKEQNQEKGPLNEQSKQTFRNKVTQSLLKQQRKRQGQQQRGQRGANINQVLQEKQFNQLYQQGRSKLNSDKPVQEQNNKGQGNQYDDGQEQYLGFDLGIYKSLQFLLQSLLRQLKQTLKYVKNDRSLTLGPRIATNSRLLGTGSRDGALSRGPSKNSSLTDIIERRRIGSSANPHENSSVPSVAVNCHGSSFGVGNQKGGRTKLVAMGLGNLGIQTSYERKRQGNNLLFGDSLSAKQEQQKQRLVINRNKLNQILGSSSQNFSKRKSGSFFIHQPHKESSDKSQRRDQAVLVQDRQVRNRNGTKMNRNGTKIKDLEKMTRPHREMLPEQQRQKLGLLITTYSLTPILKLIKSYIKVIAQGQIDDIQSLLHNSNEGLLSYNNLNELITRKKMFKTALYFQRASIISGICYGYLMITDQRGYLLYQAQQSVPAKQNSGLMTADKTSQNCQNQLKEHTQQILKYMINLASFCLNNNKLISKSFDLQKDKEVIQKEVSQPEESTNPKAKNSHVQKQIYRRNLETIKLNIQYMQQTFQKLFSYTNLSVNNSNLSAKNSNLSAKNSNLSAKNSNLSANNPNVDEDFGENFKNVSKLIGKHSIQQTFYTLLEYFAFFLSFIKRHKSIPFLAVAPNPYLDPTERYTLVIDFIEVFCYGTKKSKNFIFRPYSQHFLHQMSQYYDIVVICDALPQQIDKIVDILDSKQVIKHRLYKYHMVDQRLSGKYAKSLQRIGREMSKTILLDTEQNRLTLQPRNTIFIKQWRGLKNDSTLAQLCSILVSIAVEHLDCTKSAEKIDNQMKINTQKGIKFINSGLNLNEDSPILKKTVKVQQQQSVLPN